MKDTYSRLNVWLNEHQQLILSEIDSIVRHESPSRDKPALDTLATRLATRYARAGGDVERIRNPSGGDHLRIRFGSGLTPPALLLGHFDTVWPVGTLAQMPIRLTDTEMSGPGIFDMKTSLAMIPWAIEAIEAEGRTLPRPIVVVLTSDEEIGSPTSRDLIETEARRAAYTLVLEPPLADGRLKTERKGIGQFRVEVSGHSAHAGIEPEKGASAIVELAHQILHVGSLARPERGTTVNVGQIEGGTTPNVVPSHAWAVVDVRVKTANEAARVEEEFQSLKPVSGRTWITVTGNFRRPPMERSPAMIALFRQAAQIGAKLGLELEEGATGGASDGNFTAALGVPTLDGLGCPGGGAHAIDEHILVRELPTRIALIAALLLELNPDA